MSTSSGGQDLAAYRADLLLALRLRDVPGPRIAEALAEVESHVAETGEHPTAAFGPPRDYARQLTAVLRGDDGGPSSSWRLLLTGWTWSHAAIGLLAVVGCWLLADGLYAVAAAVRSTVGLSGATSVLLGLLVLAVLAAVLVRELRRHGDRVVDPRTGTDVVGPAPRGVLLVVYGLPLGLLALNVVLGLLAR